MTNPQHGATCILDIDPYAVGPEIYSPDILVVNDGRVINRGVSYTLPMTTNTLSAPVTVTARCKAVLNGVESAWSNYAQATFP